MFYMSIEEALLPKGRFYLVFMTIFCSACAANNTNERCFNQGAM